MAKSKRRLAKSKRRLAKSKRRPAKSRRRPAKSRKKGGGIWNNLKKNFTIFKKDSKYKAIRQRDRLESATKLIL